MCNCRCNRRRNPGVGDRPGRRNPCCGNRPGRPGQGVSPGTGSRPDCCPRRDVGGVPCTNRTPRAWQGSRYDRPCR